MVNFTKTNNNITILLDDELIMLTSDDPRFEHIASLADGGEYVKLLQELEDMMGEKKQKIRREIRFLRAIS